MVALIIGQSHNIEWCKAQQIGLSVDLVQAAKQQLQFLNAVDSTGCLYDGPAVERAIYRYKYCWLPLVAKHMECPIMEGPLVVPLDCEWIWHCHRLNPVQYKRDCEEIFGKIIGNLNVLSSVEQTSSKQTESAWNQIYVAEPYHLYLNNVQVPVSGNGLDAKVHKTIQYDLTAAVKRQSSFFSKVSKLMKQNDSFFKEAVDKYKAFLQLIKKSGELGHKHYSCVPTPEIDLIWHSHQLNPIEYSKDLNAIFGGILDHNDRDHTEKSGRKKLVDGFLRTKEVWELTYDRMYSIDIEGATMTYNKGIKCMNRLGVVKEADDDLSCFFSCLPDVTDDNNVACFFSCLPDVEVTN